VHCIVHCYSKSVIVSANPPWNLLVSLLVSLRGSYGSLKMGLRNSSYFVYEILKHPMFVINYELRRLFHAPITPSERQLETNRFQGGPHDPVRPGTSWFLSGCLSEGVTGA
jgi:hypothetical protein